MIHFVSRYVDRYQADGGAIKIPDELPVSENYIKLIGSLNVLLERKGISVVYYTLSDLKKHYCPNKEATKETIASCVVSKYPELLPELHKEQANRNSYYIRVFEAVAAASYLQCIRR